jgi:hypothetical protein
MRASPAGRGTGRLKIHGTHVTANNSANINVLALFFQIWREETITTNNYQSKCLGQRKKYFASLLLWRRNQKVPRGSNRGSPSTWARSRTIGSQYLLLRYGILVKIMVTYLRRGISLKKRETRRKYLRSSERWSGYGLLGKSTESITGNIWLISISWNLRLMHDGISFDKSQSK